MFPYDVMGVGKAMMKYIPPQRVRWRTSNCMDGQEHIRNVFCPVCSKGREALKDGKGIQNKAVGL